jgi:hypothetical protein
VNIEFSRITPNLKLDGVAARQADNADKIAGNEAKPLFSDSLFVKENEHFALGDSDGVNMDEVEKELVRDDQLGKLFSSHFNFEPPEMPVFV